MSLVAIDVGGTSVKAEILDDRYRAQRRHTVPTPAGSAAIDAAVALIEAFAMPGDTVGLAVPGLVDSTTGVGVLSTTLGWENLPIADIVRTATGLDPMVIHDIAAGGLAEYRSGAGVGCNDAAVFVIGTGIGAALVVDGQHLTRGPVGEVGHLGTGLADERCRCGRMGCLEGTASAASIARRYTQRSGMAVAGAQEVVARISDDPIAAEVWRDATDSLAETILAVTAVLATRRVVLTGGLANAGDALVVPVRETVGQRATVETPPEIVTGHFGDRSVLVGAAIAAQERAR